LDSKECEAFGLDAEAAISRCIRDSFRSYAIYDGDVLIVLWGYMPGALGGRTVRIWMLTTPGVADVRFWFARKSIELRDFFLARYLVIEAYVWKGHAPACRWLEWLGFTESEIDAKHPDFVFMRRGR
jgi:hypothetical protein